MRPNVTSILVAPIILIAFGSVVPTLWRAQAQHSKPLVEAVEVVGNRRLTEKEILSNVASRPGEPFSEKQCQRDLQELHALDVFDNTQTRVLIEQGVRGGVVVIFEVVELPLLLEVKFQGLTGIEESEIIEALREKNINLVKDAVYDVAKVRAARDVIKELLGSRGWPNAIITVRQEIGDNSTYVSIEFAISYEQ
jgi:outer membrane protein assembly factor BamA